MLKNLREKIEAVLPKIVEARRHLHTMPELLYEVHDTAAYVCEQLSLMGYEVKKGVGKTGVVALLDTGNPGKTLALRGDMDALPIQEETGLPYASKYAGKMHACGHDGHTATLLGVAEVLMGCKEELTGKVKFIFQPAEEGGNGAQAMIDDGVLENPRVDAILGYHNWPKAPVGQILTKPGAILAGFSRFEVTVKGKVGHVAMPHSAINPVLIIADLVRAWQKEVAKDLHVEGPSPVINITYMNAGKPRTGMAETAEIMGYLYAAEPSDIAVMKQRLQDIADMVIEPYKLDDAQASYDVKFVDVYYPTVNTLPETELVLSVARELFGETQVEVLPQTIMASEDFAAYLKRVPGCFFFVGAGEEAPHLHTAKYDFNDTLLPAAMMLMCQSAARYLRVSQ
jgi:amidohydrolase